MGGVGWSTPHDVDHMLFLENRLARANAYTSFCKIVIDGELG